MPESNHRTKESKTAVKSKDISDTRSEALNETQIDNSNFSRNASCISARQDALNIGQYSPETGQHVLARDASDTASIRQYTSCNKQDDFSVNQNISEKGPHAICILHEDSIRDDAILDILDTEKESSNTAHDTPFLIGDASLIEDVLSDIAQEMSLFDHNDTACNEHDALCKWREISNIEKDGIKTRHETAAIGQHVSLTATILSSESLSAGNTMQDKQFVEGDPFHGQRNTSCLVQDASHLRSATSDTAQDTSHLANYGVSMSQDSPLVRIDTSVIEKGTLNKVNNTPSVGQAEAVFDDQTADVERDTSFRGDDASCAGNEGMFITQDTPPDMEEDALNLVRDTLCEIEEALRLGKKTTDEGRKEERGTGFVGQDASLKDTPNLANDTTKTAHDRNCTIEDALHGEKETTGSLDDAVGIAQEIGCIPNDAPLVKKETSSRIKDEPVLTRGETCVKNNAAIIRLGIRHAKAISKSETYFLRECASCPMQDCIRKVASDVGPNATGISQDIVRTTQDRLGDVDRNAWSPSVSDTDTQVRVVVKTHPDGGWGWVVCLSAFLVQFIALGMLNTAGIVYTELVKEFQSPRGATAWVGSLATGIMFFLGPLTTSLCERFGCRIVTICGGLICMAGLLCSSIVTGLIPLYLTYGVVFGSGTSLCYFPTIVVLSKYFKRRIAVVNGLVTAGSGVGTLVLGPVVQTLFFHFGLANTFRIVAGIFSLVLVCGAMYRPVPAKYSQYNKQIEGGEARRYFDWSIFKNKGYIIWIMSLATFQLGYFVPFVHLVRHAEDLGVNPTNASFLIGYMSVASTIGRLFFGKLAGLSCVNRLRMYQTGLFGIALCSFLVPLVTSYGGLTAYAVTFGFFEACFVLLIPLITSDIVGVEKMSYALGSAFTVMAFPMFLGPPIAGWIYDIAGDYAVAFYSCGGTSAVAASLVFLVPFFTPKSYVKNDQDQTESPKEKMSSHQWESVLRFFFGCLWKRNQAPKSFDHVQYSVIITTGKALNV